MKPFTLILGFLCLAGLAAPPASGVQVRGRVQVIGRADDTSATTVVYAESLSGPSSIPPGRYRLAQKNKSFAPRVLAIPAGSTVDFPNLDSIFHNVFSLSRPTPFDLGLYRAGASKSRMFASPATYRVFCNIHPQMTGVILALPTPYITEADSNGNYELDLPPGRYRITAWSDRAHPATTELAVSSAATAIPDLTLDESKFVEMPHQNKFGQDYPKTAYEPIRGEKPR